MIFLGGLQNCEYWICLFWESSSHLDSKCAVYSDMLYSTYICSIIFVHVTHPQKHNSHNNDITDITVPPEHTCVKRVLKKKYCSPHAKTLAYCHDLDTGDHSSFVPPAYGFPNAGCVNSPSCKVTQDMEYGIWINMALAMVLFKFREMP